MLATVLLSAWCGMPVGCATRTVEDADREAFRGVERADAAASASGRDRGPTSRPSIIVSGVPVAREQLYARLAEAAGDVVIEELVLDLEVERQARAIGFVATPEDVENERRLLMQTILDEAGVPEGNVEELIDGVRRARGLGPHRFDALLERNAKLRALVRDETGVSGGELDEAVEAEFGEKHIARLIVTPSQRDASDIRARVMAGPTPTLADLVARFSQEAVARSKDPSAPRGGLLEPVSKSDTRLAPTVRAALRGLSVGEVSQVLAVQDSFAIVLLEGTIPGRSDITAEDRARVEARVRTRKERVAMDRLARQFLSGAKVTVFDPELQWSRSAR